MENDSNPQPQKTGGLKLMTVFIGVLALHVVVIGGITVYHLLNGGNSDTDIVATDKTHKDVKVTPDSATVSDGQLPDGSTATKTASNEPADGSVSPITIPQAPANSGDSTASTGTPAATPAPATASTTSTEGSNSSEIGAATDTPAATTVSTPNSPATASTTTPGASQPSGPIAQPGPVITPPTTASDASASTPTPATTPATDETGETSTYTVRSGDSLARIAHQHHIKIAALRAANNNMKSNMLQIGQKLTIPAQTAASAQVASTETATASTPVDAVKTQLDGSVATTAKPKHHHSEPNRTLLGDSPEITGSEVAASTHDKATLSGGGRHVYTVMKGDTLNKIARKFHTSPNAIMALNDISDARKLRLGQKLRIPTREARSAASVPAAPATPQQQQQQNPEQIEPRATPSAQLANFIN